MPQRNSTDNRENPTILRKFPRLLQQNQHDPKYPNTPNPIPKQNLVPHLDHTPLRSISDEVPLNKYKKLKRDQLSEKAKETNVLRRSSIRMSTGPSLSTRLSGGAEDFPCVRRSSRFSHKGNVEKIGCAEEFNCVRRSPRFSHNGNVESIDLRKISRRVDLSGNSLNVTEKRLTRSCNNGVLGGTRKGCNGFTKTILNEDSSAESISDKRKVEGAVSLSEQRVYKIEKRVTRCAGQGIKDEKNVKIGGVKDSKSIQHVSIVCSDKKILSDDGKPKLGANLPRTSVHSADLIGGGDWRGEVQAEKKQVGAKRKKIQDEEVDRVLQGWTTEQELALERGYFAAKPTPHFWKKVAKLVPGKSAQECFDKIHSEILTPSQPQKQSRAKGMKASLSLSACKLLNASEPEMKKPRQSKQKSHLRHKTVRQLLQKQYNADQDNEADLFTLLEPTLDPPTQFVQDCRLFSTPECNKEGPGFDKRCLERSSVHGKHLSQSKDSRGVTLISPLVLKKIKNKALHEKYIDQLHSKEAKRKAAALRAKKCIKGKIDAKENNVQRIEAVKDAKNALVFCARDAINQFHHLESSNVNNFNKTCHDFADSSEDESGQFS